jgi:hypothetical protein
MPIQLTLLAVCLAADLGQGAAPTPPGSGAGDFRARPTTPARTNQSRTLRVGVPEPRIVGDVSPRESAVLAQALVTEVRKLAGITAVGISEIREVLTQEYRRQMLGCQANQECLAEIAGALGVDELVTSELVVEGGRSTFTVSRVEMRTTRVKGNAQRRLERSRAGEEVLGVMGEVVAALFPDRPLREGETRGVAKQVARWLNPPPLPRWVIAGTGGAALLAAAGGTTFALMSNDARRSHNELVRRSATEPVSGADISALRDKAQARANLSGALFGVAAGLAVAATVEAFFTDWHDYRGKVTVSPAGVLTVHF